MSRPPVDIYETGQGLMLLADVPGATPDGLHITFAALSNEIPTFADREFERPSYTLRLPYDAVSARAAGCEAEGRAGKQAHGPAIMVTLPAGRVTGRAEHSTALGDALRDGLDRKAPVSSIHGASVTTQRMIAEPVFRRVS